jgi:hypothetical protein
MRVGLVDGVTTSSAVVAHEMGGTLDKVKRCLGADVGVAAEFLPKGGEFELTLLTDLLLDEIQTVIPVEHTLIERLLAAPGKTIIKAAAAGALLKRQDNIVRQAQVIVNASAKAGIKGLVYALAGYDAPREEVVAAFKLYVREEAREYEKEFPSQLYSEWYRLYQLRKPERNKPWKFMHLTINQVYKPLARSNGKILALTRAQKAASDDHYAKLHQFLSEIGTKALRTHLGQLLGIAQVSADREQYEHNVSKVFGVQQELDLERVE